MHARMALLAALSLLVPPGLSAEPDELTLLIRQLRHSPANPALLAELKGKIAGIENPDLEADALAIYCLGELANENTPEAIQARAALTTRHPNSGHLRLIQFDQLDRSCRFCDGVGKKRNAVCDRCSGARRCVACRGKGQRVMMNKAKVPCAACGASGRCPGCEGTGRKMAACPECKGRGSVLDLRKIRQVSQTISHEFLRKYDPAGDTPPTEEPGEPAPPDPRPREIPGL